MSNGGARHQLFWAYDAVTPADLGAHSLPDDVPIEFAKSGRGPGSVVLEEP
jgi:hypothetical protein